MIGSARRCLTLIRILAGSTVWLHLEILSLEITCVHRVRHVRHSRQSVRSFYPYDYDYDCDYDYDYDYDYELFERMQRIFCNLSATLEK